MNCLKRKIRRRDKAYRKTKKTGNTRAEAKFQKLKREVQSELRQSYWNYVEGVITPTEDGGPFSCMKRFWKFIKAKKVDHEGIAPLKVDGKLVTDPKDKAEVLNDQF